MNQFTTLDFMLLSTAAALWVSIIYMLRSMLSRSREEEIEKLRRENRELKHMLKETEERLKLHYEQLLKEAAIKNVMMRGLWEAYRSGEISRCYKDGGEVKVLADGTVICFKAKEEESYSIEGKEELERMAQWLKEEEELAKEGEGNASSE
ncbi:MAG: hypothetical protein DRO12_05175 [Thermoprotei archaeon]|nr:MAG: hypothetical protein DRO12_05175 [Thermoprotei archaeon]